MGVLDEVFAGKKGLANTLIDLLGGEAIFETIIGGEYNEDNDSTYQDIHRQRLPFVIDVVSNTAGASTVPGGENGGLVNNETLYTGIVPAANLDVYPNPLKTVIRQGNERYQVIQTEPTLVGNLEVLYKLTMKRL